MTPRIEARVAVVQGYGMTKTASLISESSVPRNEARLEKSSRPRIQTSPRTAKSWSGAKRFAAYWEKVRQTGSGE